LKNQFLWLGIVNEVTGFLVFVKRNRSSKVFRILEHK
jgi:hypothetical protein